MEMSPVLTYAIPFFFLGVLGEYLYGNLNELSLYSWPDFLSNLKVAAFTAVTKSALFSFYIVLYYFLYEQLMPIRKALFGYSVVGFGFYWWLIAVMLDDLGFYWYHRLSHQIRLFWACHVVHHSSDNFNLSVGARNSGFAVLYEPLFYLLLPILGFHPVMTVGARGINNIYQFFCHTQLRTPWDRLEPFLVTPRVHEVHHGKDDACIDKNYAGIFCFYDQFFGTYQPSAVPERIRYGVTNPPTSRGVIDVNLHELRDIWRDIREQPSWKTKLAILFNGPGWKPEASARSNKKRESRNR